MYNQRDYQAPRDVAPEYAHPTALYFDALENPSVEVDAEGGTTLMAGSLTGELPAYSLAGPEQDCSHNIALIERHVADASTRRQLCGGSSGKA